MPKMILAVCAALGFSLIAAGSAAAVKAPAPVAETLRAFVQRLLVVAPTDFSSVRGAPKGSEDYYSRYLVLAKFGRCSNCKLTDEYSWTAHNENWYIENVWRSKTMTHAKLASYVKAQLAPSLKTYSLKTAGSKDYPHYKWLSKTKTWVSVDMFNGGFTLRVGHDLAKPVHVLLAPSTQQLAALRAGVSSFVSSGVGAASKNFESLRAAGKKDILDEMTYDLYVPFGSMLPKCQVTDATANTLQMKDYSPKWTMSCETPPMVATKSAIEEIIHAAMQAALPSGFSPTTGSVLFLDDYRWDNTDTQVAVDIDSFGSYGLPDGLVKFNVGVIHFLPK